MTSKSPIFIFVSGGVISGLGKGITASSIALLLKSSGFKVSMMKVDMYLNQDAGTMNPVEHGEVFVTNDGVETDEDIGHYERFLDQSMGRKNYMTAGQIYRVVLEKERRLEYNGRCIDAYIEIPQEVIKRWEESAEGNDFFLIELGGTVGEYQNILFFEAARRLKIKYPKNTYFVHVAYLPLPSALGEMKSKPAQQSILSLNALGIFPDFIVCRAEKVVDERRKEKIALAAALERERVFSAPDVKSIYEVPLLLQKQNFTKIFSQVINEPGIKKNLLGWKKKVDRIRQAKQELKIAIVGKYYHSGDFSLADSYVSVIEAVKHAGWQMGVTPKIIWVDSERLEKEANIEKLLAGIRGVIVPGGFGSRGVEGKINAIRYARENKIPYLGLCYGMQLATVEFARHVIGWQKANTTEIDEKTPYPVIHLMTEQEKKMLTHDYGGTMRLGSWPCWLRMQTVAADSYAKVENFQSRGKKVIYERHRHRYEFNNKYRFAFEKSGIIISGTTPDNRLVEIIELPRETHPFFVGVQFHPEFQSRFVSPHPLFLGLIQEAMKNER